MAAKIFRINYKSDFILTLNSDAGWMTPFCIKFWTGTPSQAYYAYYDGMSYTHCAPVDGEPTKLQVQFDDHHLPIGDLKFQIAYHFTVADFPNSVEDEVLNQASVIIEVDNAPAQVMLDFNGETAPEIEFSLPAYANEAQRIANEEARIAAEQQRIANEDARIQAEEIRQQNEQQRIDQETARVNEFATLKSQSQAATRDANDAADLANQKAQLAADKAALAGAAATLANAKAQLAADKAALADAAATLANDKAALAQQKADYAQTQGDYAKQQGEIAEEDHERAEADHTRAESDHATAGSDHTQAGTDHTRAESDHATASADHTQAGQDHTRAESDHTQATSDHTQAGTDHTRAESDHTTASADHTQAGQDHTRAESDHTRAESDHAAVEVYVDSLGVFDLSKHNAVGGVLTTYANLDAALTALNALESKYKYGGMSFKFVQTYDNKYIQARCTANEFTNDVTKWQGVDIVPLIGSQNLVESNGVAEIFVSKGLSQVIFNIKGGINGSDGSDSSNAEFVRTGYIPVLQGMKLTYDVQEGSSGWCAIACYDSNGEYVSEASVKGTSSGLFIIPNGVAKIRLSSLVDYTNTYAKFQFVSEYTEDYPNVTTSKITDKSVTYPKLGNDANAYLNRLLDISFIGSVGYNDGSISTQAATNHKMTWFVKVLEGEKINYDLLGGSTGWAVIAAYNSSFEYIKASSIKGNASETTPSKGQYVVPSGVAYIILSGMVGYDNSISFDTFETERVVNVADERISEFDGYLLFKNQGGINADGSDSTNPDFVKTDLIEVLEGDIINANIQEGSSGWCAIACYDSQNTFMADKSILGTGQVQNIQMIVPSGVSYIKLSSIVAYTERSATKNIVIRENVLDREIKEFDGYLDFKNIGGINADGTDSPNNEFKRTDLIPVNTGDIIKASVQEGSAGWCAIACYDSSQVFVSDETILGTGQVQNILKTIPDGVSYIKISTMISYSGGYAIKNRVVRENELKTETELTRVNTVSVMKYPNILQQRGCIAIQMDLSYLDNARSGCDSMLEVMREYGLMSMDYAINITALQDAEIDKLLGRQKEGCEIIYHNRINSPSDFSNNSTLTVAKLKEGVLDERLAMAQKGFTTFGVVANVGSLATRYKPTIDNIFFWSEYGSKEILTEGAENTKTQYLSDHRIIRTAFEINHTDYTPELEAEMIVKGKAWIDELCTNKTMGVMYCHFYDRTTDVYHLYEGVLRAMCEYIAEKISDGELWYGRTTECLNYLCR